MEEKKAFNKVNKLIDIEKEIQKFWELNHLFEPECDEHKTKYFVTFPYPYMNGPLHLGHAFTLSKIEFFTGYQRLKGINCLFPLGFHCTGMPIKACADKLKYEIENYGLPPEFPTTIENISDKINIPIGKSKKSKLVAKMGDTKYQWDIMKQLGISDNDILKFVDPYYWVDFFTQCAITDIKNIGFKVDWRRSFVTTHINPFYDSFIQWQFRKLRKAGKIKFGKRYTIFSPIDKQPCMDHDRISGEGVLPQEYTLVEIEVINPSNQLNKLLANLSKNHSLKKMKIILPAATLRPETMYGQTNIWLHPDIEYVVFVVDDIKESKIYICSVHAARNMSCQGFTHIFGGFKEIGRLHGKDLMGMKLKAPFTKYDYIYSLPMLTINEDKGTAVVTSVPSDSPDDYAALMDLINKPQLRSKYGIADEMVLPFHPIPIIDIEGMGIMCAKLLCEKFKVQSQNDKDKLKQAKDLLYLKGYYDGVMVIGKYAGQKVQDVKKIIQQDMIRSGLARLYMEPESLIISRSGDKCVVALCDQWYLDYGETLWKNQVRDYVENSLDTLHSSEIRKNLLATLDWLQEHACSRLYGLGTKIPWDPEWLIESLSDSTIYMAYYTIAHLLQGPDNLKGQKPNVLGIKPEQMVDEVWDFLFGDSTLDKVDKNYIEAIVEKSAIPVEHLIRLRKEFIYWYPVDLRVSGKDLVPNHLTYYLYNHAAIWENDRSKWPRRIRANGLLNLNNEKMSKSTGNFMTLEQAIGHNSHTRNQGKEYFGADGTRLALADSGDSYIEDSNFSIQTATVNGVLRLYTFLQWVHSFIETSGSDISKKKSHLLEDLGLSTGFSADTIRRGSMFTDFFPDRVFENEINEAIKQSEYYYERMMFKEALRVAFFEFQLARDRYRELCMDLGMNFSLVSKYIEVQCLLLSPICPHITDFIWMHLLGKNGTIINAKWPIPGEVDENLLESSKYLWKSAHDFRLHAKNVMCGKKNEFANKKPTYAIIYVARDFPEWQRIIIDTIKRLKNENNGIFPDNKTISEQLYKIPTLSKYKKKVMPLVQVLKETIDSESEANLILDEKNILERNSNYLCSTLDLKRIDVLYAEDVAKTIKGDTNAQRNLENILEECCPGKPIIVFRFDPVFMVHFVNKQTCRPYFQIDLAVIQNEPVQNILEKLNNKLVNVKFDEKLNGDLNDRKIWLLRYQDPILGPRTLPSCIDYEEIMEPIEISFKRLMGKGGDFSQTSLNIPSNLKAHLSDQHLASHLHLIPPNSIENLNLNFWMDEKEMDVYLVNDAENSDHTSSHNKIEVGNNLVYHISDVL